MSDSRYPLPVERYTGQQSLTIICESCGAQEVVGPDDVHNDGLYNCPVDCGGVAVFKYAEADRCPGCGELGWYDHNVLKGACSRRCMLQAEYAATITKRTA